MTKAARTKSILVMILMSFFCIPLASSWCKNPSVINPRASTVEIKSRGTLSFLPPQRSAPVDTIETGAAQVETSTSSQKNQERTKRLIPLSKIDAASPAMDQIQSSIVRMCVQEWADGKTFTLFPTNMMIGNPSTKLQSWIINQCAWIDRFVLALALSIGLAMELKPQNRIQKPSPEEVTTPPTLSNRNEIYVLIEEDESNEDFRGNLNAKDNLLSLTPPFQVLAAAELSLKPYGREASILDRFSFGSKDNNSKLVWYVTNLIVGMPHRKQGNGKLLVKALEQECMETDRNGQDYSSALFLHTATNSLRFYEILGYQIEDLPANPAENSKSSLEFPPSNKRRNEWTKKDARTDRVVDFQGDIRAVLSWKFE